jgi:CHASE3 domain sensor protein
MDQKFEKNCLLFLFFTGIVILMGGGIWFYLQLQHALVREVDIQESYQTIRVADQAQIAIDEAGMDVGRFISTTDITNLANLPQLVIAAKINLEALNQLIQDNPDEQKIFKELQALFDKKIEFFTKMIEQSTAGNPAGATLTASDKGRIELTKQIVQKIIEIRHIEVLQLEDAKQGFAVELQRAKLIFLSTGILCVFLFLVSYIVLRRYLKKDLT